MTYAEFAQANGFELHTYETYRALTKTEQKAYDTKRNELTKEYIKTNETMETMTKHGRNVTLEGYCRLLGFSEYGTAKQKAERIMSWINANR